MEKKTLLEAAMLDGADHAALAADLEKIRRRVERAAQTAGGGETVPAKPDAAWLRCVPEHDPAAQNGAETGDAVTVRHTVVRCETPVVRGTLTVPRIVGGEENEA